MTRTIREGRRGWAAWLALGMWGAVSLGCSPDQGGPPGAEDEDPPEPAEPAPSVGALATGTRPAAVPVEPGCVTALCCPTGLTVVQGDDDPNVLGGGGSAQCLVGLGAGDTLTASTAGDFVVAGAGDDTVTGSSGVDVVHGGPGVDTVHGGAEADELHGGGGGDELHGGAGNDALHGGENDDFLYGDGNDDTLRGGEGSDVLEGGDGNDVLWPGPGRDTVLGGNGDDVIRIGSACEVPGPETVDGGPGWDVIESPYPERTLAAMGVTITGIEDFQTIPLSLEQCAETVDEWGGALTVSGEIFARLVPRPGGGALGLTPGSLHVISPTGAIVTSFTGEAFDLDPTGSGFAVTWSGTTSVYDDAGAFRYSVVPTASDVYAKLLPGGDHLYVGLVERHHEVATIDAFEIYDDQGLLRSSVSAPGLGISRLGAARVLYTDATHVHEVDLDGVLQWSAPVAVRALEATTTGTTRFIGIEALTQTTLVHYEGTTPLGATQVPGGVWNVAMAPGGVYSAANTADGLFVFVDGQVVSTTQLPLVYGKALSIDDHGEVLVAGVDDADMGRVLLLHPEGHVLWDTTLVPDRNAWRPAARFDASGDHFVVNTSLGGFGYAIDRSL